MRGRVLREESGFTLAEVLVTMLMMLTVMFALYSIFDMSLRVFSFGNDKVEATENARIGLAKMEREIRAAYPVDKENGEEHLFFSPGVPNTASFPGSDQITFGNETNGDSMITTSSPDEQITYDVSGTTLRRNGQPVVESLQDVDGDGQALTFEYLDGQGSTVSLNEADIDMVNIKLEIEVDGRSQVLETDVSLRNRTS